MDALWTGVAIAMGVTASRGALRIPRLTARATDATGAVGPASCG
jgi:hypothetical protein